MTTSIAICIPFHLRGKRTNDCYRRTFDYYSNLGYRLNLCGSEGDLSRAFADEFLNDNTAYVEVPQTSVCTLSKGDDVLRKKFNDSLQTLGRGHDWYCLAGADDIASAEVFQQLESFDPQKVYMAGVSSKMPLFISDKIARERFKVELNYRIKLQLLPGINIFSSGAMYLSQFAPYKLTGCETGAEMFFYEHGKILPLDGWVLMLKGTDVLNATDKIKQKHIVSSLTAKERKLVKMFE